MITAELKIGDRVVVNDATGNGAFRWFGKILWIESDGYRVAFDNGRDGWYTGRDIEAAPKCVNCGSTHYHNPAHNGGKETCENCGLVA